MSKTCVIYHRVDLDGCMSAAIVKHWFNQQEVPNKEGEPVNTIDFIGYNYGQPIPDLSEYDKVIMCDVSFPKEIMYDLCEKRDGDFEFIYIDHHISAINDLERSIKNSGTYTDYPAGLWDVNFAACELTWKYFFSNEEMPEIVRLLGLYDSFRHKNTDEEQKVLEFQYGARSIITNYEEAYEQLIKGINTDNYTMPEWFEILHIGKAIYQYLCTDAKQSYKNGFEIKLVEDVGKDNGPIRNFICINKERFNPINFGIDYHADGYDGCACFHRTTKGQWAFSLYNDNGEVDCSAIAKSFGGGGHRGASGFICDNDTFLKIIK